LGESAVHAERSNSKALDRLLQPIRQRIGSRAMPVP